jgi:hypothetical protein
MSRISEVRNYVAGIGGCCDALISTFVQMEHSLVDYIISVRA